MGLAALWFVLKILGWILAVIVAVILAALCLPVRARVFGEAGFSGSIGDLLDGTANLVLGWQQKSGEADGNGCDDGRGAGASSDNTGETLSGQARGASSARADGTSSRPAEESALSGVEGLYEDPSADVVIVDARGQAQASVLGGLVGFHATTGGAVTLRILGIRVLDRQMQGGKSGGSAAEADGGSAGGGSADGGSSAGGTSADDGATECGPPGGSSAGAGSADDVGSGGSTRCGLTDQTNARSRSDVQNGFRHRFRRRRRSPDGRHSDAPDSSVDSASHSGSKGRKPAGRRRFAASLKGIKRSLTPRVKRKTLDFAKKAWRRLNVSLDVDVEYGLDDPGYTGMAYAAYLSAGNMLGLKGLRVRPNFTQEMLQARGNLQMRLIPVALVWSFAAYALSRDIRPLWSLKRRG